MLLKALWFSIMRHLIRFRMCVSLHVAMAISYTSWRLGTTSWLIGLLHPVATCGRPFPLNIPFPIRRERAKIGQDLFSGGASVPLQFPASFTFVFRAFTTLDGIGKTLDPVYDLTRIASPYLKALLDLKDGSAYMSVLKTWQKRLGDGEDTR